MIVHILNACTFVAPHVLQWYLRIPDRALDLLQLELERGVSGRLALGIKPW